MPPHPSDPAVVQTAAGMVRGIVAPDHRLFAGIPYAAPPVGPLRWQPPAPGSRVAGGARRHPPGPRCIQDRASDLECGRHTDEDCLTLNVWTPPSSEDAKPVMVWIHGGAFINGSGGIYDARWLASRGDIVVVTVNYRLGALGFLAHPALGRRARSATTAWPTSRRRCAGCATTSPTSAAIRARSRMAGESAGGMSVCDHLVAPGSAGLFRAAIMQSAPCQAQGDTGRTRRRSASTMRPKRAVAIRRPRRNACEICRQTSCRRCRTTSNSARTSG